MSELKETAECSWGSAALWLVSSVSVSNGRRSLAHDRFSLRAKVWITHAGFVGGLASEVASEYGI